jgi:hypothetical protein
MVLTYAKVAEPGAGEVYNIYVWDEDYLPDCTGNQSWIGDGGCDSSNNTEDCGWDGGDCCESTDSWIGVCCI